MVAVREQNYWPGFVDALSNVVLTLIFVLVVFIIALLITSNKVEKRAMEMVHAAKEKQTTNKPTEELQKALDKALAKIEELKEAHELAKVAKQDIVDQQKAVEKRFVSSKIGEQLKSNFIAIERTSDRIVLYFPRDVAAFDADALEEFDEVLDSVKDMIKGNVVVINSYLGEEAYTSARRLAYYRILNVRNRLISQGLSTSKTIEAHIYEKSDKGGGYVEIVFR